MERTGAIQKGSQAQYLDKLQVERERGITVKAQTASLVFRHADGHDYLLNLIDTPGHVDFSYEVSRSLAACQGALLVVDAGQGIQAQTVANFHLASEQGLDIVPLINKIDLPAAEPERVAQQIEELFGLSADSVLLTSAKSGKGLDAVLPAVIQRVSPPRGSPDAPLRMLLFDAFHDEYRGVICLVEIVDGSVAKGDRITAASTGEDYDVQEVGILAPEMHPTGLLRTGQVGYIIPGIKSIKAVRVGDTLHHVRRPVPVLPGFRAAKSMVYAGLYPVDGEDFEQLSTAMEKLTLNDASVVVKKETSDALGPGFRCGFLGMLHMEVFMQRLEQEYGASVVTTTPTVPYIVDLGQGSTLELEKASDFPLDIKVNGILEPTVNATIVVPSEYVGRVIELCQSRHGEQVEHAAMGPGRTLLRYVLPLAELASDFYSELKSKTQGYATFDYEEGEYRPANLQRLDILVHGKVVDALARMVHRSDVEKVGRSLCSKLANLLDRQQFEVGIQAAANGRVFARETLRAMRKNVTAKCYGGDISRKRKLLDRQREGKRRMKRLGSIDVPQDLFPQLMKSR
eukprot:CAMPEP_0202908548 /NCGR_PEP_ID=MMETSP1392-20130828/46429_1 /ASSEMBLY_ACC=CAM_ASM_000868 /TAXON_ID=225041 /ORGANISM="Chlamydomonas chlamydogama, Strain SAG 11-48b" /LENGTH=570 /DNA_ID=CAMNT_0049597945 /DNA_START=323 /DNA_END=2035 /DNA_ORIENTATION=+